MSDNKQTAATSYKCEAQQRLLFVQSALAGHEVNGISLTEISNALAQRTGKTKGGQKNNVFRDLQNLRDAGYAEQLPGSDLWRLGPKLVQIAQAHLRELDRAGASLDETRQRYGREFK